MPQPFGQKLLLLERIALGGMAEVFRAKSFGVEGFERLVAVKRILPSLVQDAEFIKMFIDEARIAAHLSHQNIIQIYDLGRHDDLYYISMEYVAGRDLRLILDHFKRKKAPMEQGMAAYVLARIAEALDYAHRKRDPAGKPLRIIHRDVSPQNVMVSYDGDVKLCDFGIAKAAVQSTRTQAGVLKGKFAYMSPEQVRGRPIDHRSDLFALGVIFFEMLTAERLFLAENDYTTLENVREAKVPKPRSVNRAVSPEAERICLKLLAKEPEARYQSAAEVFEDLFQLTSQAAHRFHARHLRQFMHDVYAKELSAENAKLESYLALGPDGVAGPLEPTGDLEDPGLSPAVSALLALGPADTGPMPVKSGEPVLAESRPREERAPSQAPGAGVFDRLLYEAQGQDEVVDPVTAHDFDAQSERSEDLRDAQLRRELQDARAGEASSSTVDGPTLDGEPSPEEEDMKTEHFPTPDGLLGDGAGPSALEGDDAGGPTIAKPIAFARGVVPKERRRSSAPPPSSEPPPRPASGAARPFDPRRTTARPSEPREAGMSGLLARVEVRFGGGDRGLGLMALGLFGFAAVAVVALVALLGRTNTASLSVETSPTQTVRVYLDGSLVSERTPLVQDRLELGPHVIELVAEGYETYRQEFRLDEARPHTLSIPLTPERR